MAKEFEVHSLLLCAVCTVYHYPPSPSGFQQISKLFFYLTSLCQGTNPSEIAGNWPKASIRLANKICAKDELKPLLDFFFFFNFPPKLLLDGTIFGCGKKPLRGIHLKLIVSPLELNGNFLLHKLQVPSFYYYCLERRHLIEIGLYSSCYCNYFHFTRRNPNFTSGCKRSQGLQQLSQCCQLWFNLSLRKIFC